MNKLNVLSPEQKRLEDQVKLLEEELEDAHKSFREEIAKQDAEERDVKSSQQLTIRAAAELNASLSSEEEVTTERAIVSLQKQMEAADQQSLSP